MFLFSFEPLCEKPLENKSTVFYMKLEYKVHPEFQKRNDILRFILSFQLANGLPGYVSAAVKGRRLEHLNLKTLDKSG